MELHNTCRALGMIIVAITAVDCTSNSDGTLTQNWSIAGLKTENACSANNATQARLVIFDANLYATATHFSGCNAFTTTFDLPQGTYTSALTFLDVNGASVS